MSQKKTVTNLEVVQEYSSEVILPRIYEVGKWGDPSVNKNVIELVGGIRLVGYTSGRYHEEGKEAREFAPICIVEREDGEDDRDIVDYEVIGFMEV
jgi:hypothetical protein